MCKTLIVGNRYSYWNPLLINDDLHCRNTIQGIKIINELLNDKNIINNKLIEINNSKKYLIK